MLGDERNAFGLSGGLSRLQGEVLVDPLGVFEVAPDRCKTIGAEVRLELWQTACRAMRNVWGTVREWDTKRA